MDKRRFGDVISNMKRAERDVDTVLDAARLSRNETQTRMTGEQKMQVITNLFVLIGAIAFLAFLTVPFLLS